MLWPWLIGITYTLLIWADDLTTVVCTRICLTMDVLLALDR